MEAMKTFLPGLLVLSAIGVQAAQPVKPNAAAADPRSRAYAATTVAEAQRLLGIAEAPLPGKRVLLEVPHIVAAASTRGAAVTARVTSAMPGTDWMAVLVERGPQPLVRYKDFAPGAKQVLEVQLHLQQTTRVRALVRSEGKVYQVVREVKVARPGSDPL